MNSSQRSFKISLSPCSTHTKTKNAQQLVDSIARWLGGTRTAVARDYLVYQVLYQVDDELTRPLVLDFIKTAPLTPPHFRVMRHLLKAAELRLDAEVFGCLAYRFATTSHNYETTRWTGSWGKDGGYEPSSLYINEKNNPDYPWGRTVSRDDVNGDETTFAYSKATRNYMRRRMWRVLRRLGRESSSNYVPMATGVLLPYRDEDAQEAQTRTQYGYRYQNGQWRYHSTSTHYGPWASFITFGHILYTHSTRFEWRHGRAAWRVVEGTTHDAVPKSREEAFSKLWDDQPHALLHLLDESRAEEVHRFAVKALDSMSVFCDALPMDALLMMLDAPFEVTAEFGFKLFKKRYDAHNPDLFALVKLATCSFGNARAQARKWLQPHAAAVTRDDRLLALLFTSVYGSARDMAKTLVGKSMPSPTTIQQTVTRVVAYLLGLSDEESLNAYNITQTLYRSFGDKLSGVGASVVGDLLSRELEATHLLAAYVLKHQSVDFIDVNHVKMLIASAHQAVREIGMEIFGNLSESILLDSEELLVALCVHELDDLRKAAHIPIKRLAAINSTFATRVAQLLIDVLLLPEAADGVHQDVLVLIRDELFEQLRYLDQDTVYTLLRAKPSAAKELGGLLLRAYVPSSQLSILEIVELGRNEILAVREACWAFMESELYRIKAAKQTALRVLDSDWEDTRAFVFSFFNDRFEDQDWTPELLVSLCDSIRQDVQQFGKKMIQRFFKEDDGLEYLIRLSEHPSVDLQLFATNYLERFASDQPEEIAKLEYYFTSVLSRVNKGGVAKARIFDFLNKEAAKNEQSASVIGAILSRQSASITIQDRARAIETMITIHQTYPHIELALSLTPVEVRHGV